jgi:phosphate transport system substrate-binding protein
MKRLISIIVILSLSTGVAWAAAKNYRIGILMWSDSPHEQQTAAGFREGLALSGLRHEFEQLVVANDYNHADSVLARWQKDHFNLIFTVGDRATRYANQRIRHIPIVFSAVTNPVSDDLVDKWNMPGGNITGASSWVDVEKKLETFRRAKPRLKAIGVMFNAENMISTDEVCTMFTLAQAQGLQLYSESILSGEDIEPSLLSLLEKNIDALWLPEDELIFDNLKKIAEFASEHKLSVLSSTLKGVENTPEYLAFAQVGLTVDYHKLGHRSVFHAVSILDQGFPAMHLPVETLPAIVVANTNAADAIGQVMPPLFLAYSDRVISGFAGEKISVPGTGDSQELLRELASAFEQKLSSVGKVEVPESVGSTGGIKALLADRATLARTARALHESEVQQGLKSVQFAVSPVVFTVHPSVTGIDNLNSRDIVDIYAGRIVDWREVGARRNRIYAVSREPGDSSLQVIKKKLEGFDDITAPSAKVIFNTPDTVRTLINHRFTLGYVPLSAIKDSDLKVMKLDNVYPSAESVLDGSYPLVVPYYIAYRDEPMGLAKAFIDFIFSDEGRKIIENSGAIPVRR